MASRLVDELRARDLARRNGYTCPAPEPYPEAQRGEADDSPPNENHSEKKRDDEYKGDPEPAPRVEIFTAAELLATELPEPKWAVESILPEGLVLLAGKPKLGKSQLALNVALAVATGGVALGNIRVDPGDVLYLALEDTKRRLKSRLLKLLERQQADGPKGLNLARTQPRQDKGGLFAIAEWLGAHKSARLVIIDTWPKFRPARGRSQDSYEEDYSHASEVKALADHYGVAVLALAHCRKLDAADPLDQVSGTLGLTGAADGVMVLKRERGRHDATLFITGRDIDEQEIALQWDPQYALWSILGAAEEYRLSRERQEVIDLLTTAGKPLTPSEAAPLLGKHPNNVKQMLWTMAQQGQIENTGDGKYTITNPANRTNPNNPAGAGERKP